LRTILAAGFTRPAKTCLLLLMAVLNLAAVEHHGRVTFNGLPVPGVTVTATEGGKRLTAVTDQQGAYAFRTSPKESGRFASRCCALRRSSAK